MPGIKCPRCGLFNPDSVQRCDCGYDFERETVATAEAVPRRDPTAGVVHLLITVMLSIPQLLTFVVGSFLVYSESQEWSWAWLKALGNASAVPFLIAMIIHLPLTVAVGISAVLLTLRNVSPRIKILAWVDVAAAIWSSYFISTNRAFRFY